MQFTEEFVTKLANYLASKPFIEVHQLINEIQKEVGSQRNLMPVPEPEDKEEKQDG